MRDFSEAFLLVVIVVAVQSCTNICNSAQKENVKLGWAKHIPNFTENGQK
jgi:hypothetical protein